MSVAEEKPAVDAILLKVLEAVPFQLTDLLGCKPRAFARVWPMPFVAGRSW